LQNAKPFENKQQDRKNMYKHFFITRTSFEIVKQATLVSSNSSRIPLPLKEGRNASLKKPNAAKATKVKSLSRSGIWRTNTCLYDENMPPRISKRLWLVNFIWHASISGVVAKK
jgi:hypothetical protein